MRCGSSKLTLSALLSFKSQWPEKRSDEQIFPRVQNKKAERRTLCSSHSSIVSVHSSSQPSTLCLNTDTHIFFKTHLVTPCNKILEILFIEVLFFLTFLWPCSCNNLTGRENTIMTQALNEEEEQNLLFYPQCNKLI